jgi:hypothetical protein
MACFTCRDVATSAMTCCNQGCVNVRGSSEQSLGRSKCGRCSKVAYCSRDCQKADWVRHKLVCRHLKQMA